MVNFVRGGVRVYNHPRAVFARLDSTEGSPAAAGVPAHMPPDETNRSDTYLTALLKLIPAEIVSVYMAVRDSAATHGRPAAWFFLCLGTCFILRIYASLPKTAGFSVRDVQWRGVAVSCVAFLLWAFSIGSDRPVPWIPLDPWLASAIAGLLTLLAPLLVAGDPNATDN